MKFLNYSDHSTGWTWSFGDGGTSQEKEPSHIFKDPGTYFVTLTAAGQHDMISALTRTLEVHSLPEAKFEVEAYGRPGSGEPVYFYNHSAGAGEYEWHFGDGNVSHDAEPLWYYDKPGTYDITLIARNAYGCTDTAVMENAFGGNGQRIFFPNAFSPDRNGPTGGYYRTGGSNHDVFHPYTDEIPETWELKVFNRNGNLVFESHDIRMGWDGYFQGRLQPRGVYIWKAKGRFADGEPFEMMGDVTVIYR